MLISLFGASEVCLQLDDHLFFCATSASVYSVLDHESLRTTTFHSLEPKWLLGHLCSWQPTRNSVTITLYMRT